MDIDRHYRGGVAVQLPDGSVARGDEHAWTWFEAGHWAVQYAPRGDDGEPVFRYVADDRTD